jgi:hypothetical protein
MKLLTTTIILFLTLIASGQENISDSEIKLKTDSILNEGNLLYKLERAAWVSTDMAMARNDIKKKYGGYLIYQSGDTVKSIVFEKGVNECIYELQFTTDFSKPYKEIVGNRQLTENENKLQLIKLKIIDEALSTKYKVTCPEGYSLNMQLIPYNIGYKLYIFSGTSQNDLVPLGNDYVFFANTSGEISSWRKFHSRLIYSPTKYNGKQIVGLMHSHLKTEPYITATDICTFKLYAELCLLDNFEVLSTAFSKYFKYNLKEDKIEVRDANK